MGTGTGLGHEMGFDVEMPDHPSEFPPSPVGAGSTPAWSDRTPRPVASTGSASMEALLEQLDAKLQQLGAASQLQVASPRVGPVPSSPRGMEDGAYCSSGRRRDVERAACKPWCKAAAHCRWCKCRSCGVCQHLPPLRPAVPNWYNASYRPPCRRCAEQRRVWAVHLPCESRALPSLPREPGCWLRSPSGCRSDGGATPSVNIQRRMNWTRHEATGAADCLVSLPATANRRCYTPRELKAWHSVQAVLVTARGGGGARAAGAAAVGAAVAAAVTAAQVHRRRYTAAATAVPATATAAAGGGGGAGAGCTMIQPALPWQVPKRGLCFSSQPLTLTITRTRTRTPP